MNIIEKLGIMPGPWELKEWDFDAFIGATQCEDFSNVICQPVNKYKKGSKLSKPWDACKYLIAAAPEMLEALIDMYAIHEEDFNKDGCSFECPKNGEGECHYCPHVRVHDYRHVIEKATGKTWEELNALIDETDGSL